MLKFRPLMLQVIDYLHGQSEPIREPEKPSQSLVHPLSNQYSANNMFESTLLPR